MDGAKCEATLLTEDCSLPKQMRATTHAQGITSNINNTPRAIVIGCRLHASANRVY
jgi:hypothetical protein